MNVYGTIIHIAKKWRQPNIHQLRKQYMKCSIDKQWSTLIFRRKYNLKTVTTWTTFQGIMLSEISQTWEDIYVILMLLFHLYGIYTIFIAWFHLYEVCGIVIKYTSEGGIVVTKDWGAGGWMGSYCLMGTEFEFGMMKSSSGGGWQWWLHNEVNVLSATQLYT